MNTLPIDAHFPASASQMAVVAMLCMSFMFLFAGVFAPLKQIVAPDLAYINPLYYGETLHAHVFFREGFYYEPIGYNATTQSPPLISREEALERYSLTTPAWVCVLALVGILVVTRILAFVMLSRKFRKVLLTNQSAQVKARWYERAYATIGNRITLQKRAKRETLQLEYKEQITVASSV